MKTSIKLISKHYKSANTSLAVTSKCPGAAKSVSTQFLSGIAAFEGETKRHDSLFTDILHLLRYGAISLDNDLVQMHGSLDRAGLLVNPLEFLQRTTLGLDAAEPPDKRLKDIPADEDPNVVRRDIADADRGRELADEANDRNNKAGER
jgi:hypothetical protein